MNDDVGLASHSGPQSPLTDGWHPSRTPAAWGGSIRPTLTAEIAASSLPDTPEDEKDPARAAEPSPESVSMRSDS